MILGTNIGKNLDVLAMLMQYGLAWGVKKVRLALVNEPQPNEKPTFYTNENGTVIEATEDRAIVRDDNNHILSIQKESYEVYDNYKLGDLFLSASEKSGLTVDKAGSFKGGALVYMQFNSSVLHLDNDTVNGRFTVINSFDGSKALGMGLSNTVISCMNTFNAAYKQVQSKIRHTKNMQLKVDDVINAFDEFRKEEQDHFKLIRKLTTAPLTPANVDLAIKTMFDVSASDILNTPKEISTRKMNDVIRFQSALQTELTQKGNTLWGLFNGVTRYTSHMIKNTDAEREEAKLFGTVANKERALFAAFSKMVA